MRPQLKRVVALVALALVVGLLWWARSGGDPGPVENSRVLGSASASATPSNPAPAMPNLDAFTVALGDLPPEAITVIGQIETGGPFAYPKDGSTFGNREKLLPLRERGYYREYTVMTPGSKDRGARRIIAGGSGELYYTADHYATFRLIKATR